MKLIVQIPCYNEEATLPQTLRGIPREIPGVDKVEVLVVDDGSGDRTAQVARENGADHVIRLSRNRGLGRAFQAGLEACLERGADVIVTTDGDDQYPGGEIPRLIAPIVNGEADVVIGTRDIRKHPEFSWMKKRLQIVGNWVVRQVAGLDVQDAVSGFRALSRAAATRIHIFTDYDFNVEMIVQVGCSNLRLAQVPVAVHPKTRTSRLFRRMEQYAWRCAVILLRTFTVYRPLKFFTPLGGLFFSAGFLLGVRFLFYYFSGRGNAYVQSLILAAVLMIIGFQFVIFGLVAYLVSVNRSLLEKSLARRVFRAEGTGS